MRVSRHDWQTFTRRLAQLNQAAGAAMEAWLAANPTAAQQEIEAAAFAIATRYGESVAAVACLMYDAIGEAQGVTLPPAEPAPTATYEETVKAVRGTLKNGHSTVPATVSRLVKQAGADTMLQNARRDGAEFAWIPRSDSCPFCLMLASNGWRRMSAKALKNGHAEHIHANCDCEYCVRHDGASSVEGYEPQAIYDRLYDADPEGSWEDRVNALRREQYKADADRINQQKRLAYRARRDREAAE